MNLTTISEISILENCRKDVYFYLSLEKYLVEQCFDWITLEIKGKILFGDGLLELGNRTYRIDLKYSPFFIFRYDRIHIMDSSIKYSKAIHLYNDMSLCLYHPIIDKPRNEIIPLFRILPWISEWCIFYEEWKKYGVWLGRQIEH